jgi:hypothetical protein
MLEQELVSDPAATLGLLELHRGSTTFEVMVVATSADQARSFLDSFPPQ